MTKKVGRPPGSRNKIIGRMHIEEMAREMAPRALKGLSEIANDANMPPAARVAAMNSIIDRGYGRATQAVKHSGDSEGDPINLGVILVDPKNYSEPLFIEGEVNGDDD